MIDGKQIVHIISEGCKRAGMSVHSAFNVSGLKHSLYFKWRQGVNRPQARSVARLQRGMLRSAAALVATARELEAALADENRAAALSVLDDPFHGCALFAYMEVWAETKQFPPDSETVRRRAYAYYETENARLKAAREEQPATEEPC